MIRLTIDGKEVVTEEGRTILEAARENGIYIPTFCFHEKLLPIGSCRLCLVDVDGYDKPMTSCTTPAQDGINVTTQSEKLFKMRRQFLQLILTSHPLDCPQCDKGGECQLQNISYEHQIEKTEYEALRTDHKEDYPTPLIHYWESRCVLCGRCFHACREISGREAIDIVGNGFESRIASVNKNDCISCGECLSVCPVGALTETLSAVKSRIWQSERVDTTCPHCGFGCQLTLNVLDGKTITKVVTEKGLAPNNDSLCVRGRFGYDFVNSAERITAPWQNADGRKRPVSMEDALSYTAEALKKISAAGKGAGFVVSPRATNEEIFLISRIAVSLNNARVASAASYHTGKAAAALMDMGVSPLYDYKKIQDCRTIVVAGADLLINNHLVANKVREAVKLHGARIVSIDPLDNSLARISSVHLQPLPGQDARLFNAFSGRLLMDKKHSADAEAVEGFAAIKGQLESASAEFPAGVDPALFDKAYRLIADSENVCVIFGSGITAHDESLAALLNFCMIKGLPQKGMVMPVALQANALGAVSLLENMARPEELMEDAGVAGLFFYEDDPFGYLNGGMVEKSLAAKEFVAVCDILPTFVMEKADVVVPSASFAEKEGSFISGNGALRMVNKACKGPSSGFDFLNALLGRLGGKTYADAEMVTEEIRAAGMLEKTEGGGERLSAKNVGKPAFATNDTAGPAAPKEGAYRLILRDIFMNHHLADKELYSKGVGSVQNDALLISPEDAAELKISSGDVIVINGDAGEATSSVVVKSGIRKGVMECILFRRHKEMLSLSSRPSKVIDVTVTVRKV